MHDREIFVNEKRKKQAVLIGIVVVSIIILSAAYISEMESRKRPPTLLPVSGVVSLNGEPLKKVIVRFIPKTNDGSEYIASGITDDDGRYTLMCNDLPGACAGENQVLVQETQPPVLPKDERGHPKTEEYYKSLGGRPIPPQYGKVVTSPITVEVTVEKKKYNINLTREKEQP